MNNHVIITSGRTGSFLLSAILNMHPECTNRGEIFGEIRSLFISKIFWENPDYMVENFWFKDYSNIKSKGFKFLYFHDLKRENKISELVEAKDYKVIHLKRRNRLKKYISHKKVSENSGEWGDNFLINNDDNPWLTTGKIFIDPNNLLRRFEIEEEQEKIYDEKFPDALEIYYEDMVSDFDINFTSKNNKTIQKCFEYLDLDYQKMINDRQDVNSFLKETDLFALEKFNLTDYTAKINRRAILFDNNRDFILKKTRILPIQDCILNYDQVKEKLYETKYVNYLEEQYFVPSDFKYKDVEYLYDRPISATFEVCLKKLLEIPENSWDGEHHIHTDTDYLKMISSLDKTYLVRSHFEKKHQLNSLLRNNNIDIDILKKNKVLLKGGAVLRLFMNLPLDTDLDFYFLDHERMENVDEYFSENHNLLSESPAYRKYQCGEIVVDIVRHKQLMGTYEEMVGDFDFTISTSAYDFDLEKFKYPQEFIDDLNSKKISLNTTISKERAVVTLHRAEKYKELGFEFPKELYNELKKDSKLGKTNELYMRFNKMSWLRNEELSPVIPNIDTFVNWLMDIKKHKYFNKFNYYLTGGFISRPDKTKDVDIIITKRNGQYATLKELEILMVDMFNLAYDIHGFFLDTFYMRTPQWIANYPRDREILKSVEKKQLFITITKDEDKGIDCKHKRYGKLNCAYTGSFTLRGIKPSVLVHRWVDLNGNYAKWVDIRRIIRYYENNKERNMKDFLNKFEEYSGY